MDLLNKHKLQSILSICKMLTYIHWKQHVLFTNKALINTITVFKYITTHKYTQLTVVYRYHSEPYPHATLTILTQYINNTNTSTDRIHLIVCI